MTKSYHKTEETSTRHVNRHTGYSKVSTKDQKYLQKTLCVASPAGSFVLRTDAVHGDLINAQVLKEDYIEEYYSLDDYLTNSYKEWEQWTSQLAERINHIKEENHIYLSLFEEHDHGN